MLFYRRRLQEQPLKWHLNCLMRIFAMAGTVLVLTFVVNIAGFVYVALLTSVMAVVFFFIYVLWYFTVRQQRLQQNSTGTPASRAADQPPSENVPEIVTVRPEDVRIPPPPFPCPPPDYFPPAPHDYTPPPTYEEAIRGVKSSGDNEPVTSPV